MIKEQYTQHQKIDISKQIKHISLEEIEREMNKRPIGPHWYTKFKKVEVGEVDDRGYFKIVEVK